jgi:hypothetical protein
LKAANGTGSRHDDPHRRALDAPRRRILISAENA